MTATLRIVCPDCKRVIAEYIGKEIKDPEEIRAFELKKHICKRDKHIKAVVNTKELEHG